MKCVWGRKKCIHGLVGKPEEHRPLESPRLRLENYIKTDMKETEWERVNWIYWAKDRDKGRALVSTVMILRVL
jgi:hypothetical protein